MYEPEDLTRPFETGSRFITPWDELLDAKPPTFVVDGIIPKGQVAWLYGKSGIGKSLLASSIALAVAYGEPVFGAHQVQQCNVLWLDYENGTDEHMERLRSAGWDLENLAADGKVHIGSLPESINPENSFALVTECERNDIGMLIIDSSGVGFEGDSNAADTFADLAKHLFNPLKRLGITILILDNTGKDSTKGAIGSSRKTHEAGVIWELSELKVAGVYSMIAKKRRTRGVADRVQFTKQLDPLRFIAVEQETVSAIVLTPDQENMVMFLDGLEGAKWMGVRAQKGKLRDAGLRGRDTVLEQAIKWWNKGDHSLGDRPGDDSSPDSAETVGDVGRQGGDGGY